MVVLSEFSSMEILEEDNEDDGDVGDEDEG